MSMTEPSPSKRSPIWILALTAIIPAAVVAGVLWFIFVHRERQQSIARVHQTVLNTSGLSRPTNNRLDESRFADADRDLVADPPTDPAKLIDPETLVFSYVAIPRDPDEPVIDPYKAAFAEFVEHLSKVTGKRCEYRVYPSLNEQLKAMRDGELHVAAFNTGGVPIAVDLSGFVPMFKFAASDGTSAYRMQIIVPSDSPIQKVADLKNRELTLTEPSSNSGYKAPLVLLRSAHNLDPERDYILRYSLGHENSIRGIASKAYQAAAVAGDVLKRAMAHGEIQADQFRVIYESEVFPTACFGYAHNLKLELIARIREAFTSFNWSGTGLEKEFATSDQSKFVPANFKDDWSLVRRIDDQIGAEYKID